MKVKISRDGSNWSGKKFKVEAIDNFVDMVKWMTAHGYKMRMGYENRKGQRVMHYYSDKSNVTYIVTVL